MTSDELEELLAAALAAFESSGEAGLQRFLSAHPGQRGTLERGVARCREMGLLGDAPAARDFPEQLGEFRLLRRLGGGGMGVVYEAEQTSLGRRVALKVIRPELLYFEGARERFRREVEAIARLSHPSIVPVLASGEQDGVPWYAMELLHGLTIQEICTALHGRSPAELDASSLRGLLARDAGTGTDPFHGEWWQVCVRLVHTVAQGIRHVHLRGIVHRDIKPSNVMLIPDGRAVLLDFGIAAMADAREFTRTGATPGSPAFMSPEQLRGDVVDERTDVYSLAATLWQMLTLEPPFRGIDDLARIRDGDVPSARAHNRSVPPELEVVLRTAMDRDRERRYRDMDAFAADLQAVLLRRPIQARRIGITLRSVRWCQRHRVAATALAAVLIAAATVPALFAWTMHDRNVALQNANDQAARGLDATLAALHAVLVRFTNERLRNVPGADRMAIAALRDATDLYRRLLTEHPEHQLLRQRAGMALDSLAGALARVGKVTEAVAIAREALQVLAGGGAPPTPGIIDGRAHVEQNLAATLIAHGRESEAAPLLDAAERDFLAGADLPAWRGSSLRGQSSVKDLRADVLSEALDGAAIERLYRESLALALELQQLEPNDAGAAQIVVRRTTALAVWLSHHGKRVEAIRLLQESITAARTLKDDDAVFPPVSSTLADLLSALGNALLDARDHACAPLLRECLTLREALAAEHPFHLEMRANLGGAHHNIGRMCYLQERDKDALVELDQAAALQRSCLAENGELRVARDYLRNSLVLRGSVLRHLKDLDGVVANANELASDDMDAGRQRSAAYQFLRATQMIGDAPAGSEAAAARADHERRAMDCLLRAEQLGWGKSSRLQEKIYEPLHRFPEWTGLCDRVARRLTMRSTQPSLPPSPESVPSTSNASRDKPR